MRHHYFTEDSEDVESAARQAEYPKLTYSDLNTAVKDVQKYAEILATGNYDQQLLVTITKNLELVRIFMVTHKSLQVDSLPISDVLSLILVSTVQARSSISSAEDFEAILEEGLWAVNAHQQFTSYYAENQQFVHVVLPFACKYIRQSDAKKKFNVAQFGLRLTLNCLADSRIQSQVRICNVVNPINMEIIRDAIQSCSQLHSARLYLRTAFQLLNVYDHSIKFVQQPQNVLQEDSEEIEAVPATERKARVQLDKYGIKDIPRRRENQREQPMEPDNFFDRKEV